MSDNHLTFVFPAYTDDYKDHPASRIDGFEPVVRSLLQEAASLNAWKIPDFDFTTDITDPLAHQYFTFIYSCAASSTLNTKGLIPTMVAGYSMGIYAAFVQAGALRFNTGLELIRLAYQTISAYQSGDVWKMGAIIGLDRDDLIQLIENNNLRAEITNQNASHSFVVTGLGGDVVKLLQLAREEGALHTRDLSADQPYHHSCLHLAAEKFAVAIGSLIIDDPKIQVISLIDQAVLTSANEIRQELVRNLYLPLNWFKTQQALLRMGVSTMIECGASRGLVKNAKFIHGNYRFLSLNSLEKEIK